MANKKVTEQRRREAVKKKYLQTCGQLRKFCIIILALLAVCLLLYFVPWIQNYNKDSADVEFEANGWVFIFATLSNTYSNTIWGDLWGYYGYAPANFVILGVITVLSLVALIVVAVLNTVVFVKRRYNLIWAALIACTVFFALIVAAMVVAILFNQSGIYYASLSAQGARLCDPEQCTMYTWIYFSVGVALIGLIISIITAVKYNRANNMLYDEYEQK